MASFVKLVSLFAFHAPCTGSPPPLRFLMSLAEIEKAVDEIVTEGVDEIGCLHHAPR